jgi:hypothetical protein
VTISIAKVQRWISEEFGVPGTVGPNPMPDMPDAYVLVTLLPGAGLTMDDQFDRPSFQVAVRGQQFAEQTPDAVAQAIDRRLIKELQYPHELWGEYVVTCSRTGGGPSPLQSYDKGRRVIYTCTYWVLCDL